MSRGYRWFFLALVAVAVGVFACLLAQGRGDSPLAQYVHLDGYDPDAGVTLQTINLWKDYDDRSAGVAGVGAHGERVRLVRRSGDGVLVELANRQRGWVTYWFIREFK